MAKNMYDEYQLLVLFSKKLNYAWSAFFFCIVYYLNCLLIKKEFAKKEFLKKYIENLMMANERNVLCMMYIVLAFFFRKILFFDIVSIFIFVLFFMLKIGHLKLNLGTNVSRQCFSWMTELK